MMSFIAPSQKSKSTTTNIQYQAKLNNIFCVQSFKNALDLLMPAKEEWRFTDDHEDKTSISMDPHEATQALSRFVVLQLKYWQQPAQSRYPLVAPTHKLRRGDTVYAVSTPFGILSPNVFMNSISKV